VVQAFSVFLDTFVICTCTALLILLSGFYTPGFEGDGIVLTQNSLAAVVGDWGRMFISVALSLFVFTSILYNYYLGENSLQFLRRNRKALMGSVRWCWRWWSGVRCENLGDRVRLRRHHHDLPGLRQPDGPGLLFKVGMRIMRDYDDQRAAGIKQPVFDSAKFPTWTWTEGLADQSASRRQGPSRTAWRTCSATLTGDDGRIPAPVS
jgi:AGCS family alanine or glycine:cation symporter